MYTAITLNEHIILCKCSHAVSLHYQTILLLSFSLFDDDRNDRNEMIDCMVSIYILALPEFNIRTNVYGLKSFCNSINFSPVNDFKQMSCTLKGMMDVQWLD